MYSHIVHLADIHINPARAEEYTKVFETLMADISAQNGSKLIIICGDLFHNKRMLALAPDEITIGCKFLRQLAAISTLVIIPGNHDGNTHSNDGRELIKPLIAECRDMHNIHYYNKTGTYPHDNIILHVKSVFDPKPMPAFKKSEGLIHVALVHEHAEGAVVRDHVFTSNSINRTFFDKYDLTLAGDIHEMQYLGNTKTAAYCGSLIQQNITESSEKGYLYWNVATKTAAFRPIANDWGFVRMVVDGVKNIVYPPAPKIIRDISIEYKNCTQDEIAGVISNCRAKYGIEVKRIRRTDVSVVTAVDRSACLSVDVHADLIGDILCDTPLLIPEIRALHNKRYIPEASTAHQWSLVSMQWAGLYCYKNASHINFSELRGLTGIIAPNFAGKSSVFDILIYGLFNKILRGCRDKIVNASSNRYDITIVMMIDGVRSVIEKTGSRKDSVVSFTHGTTKLASAMSEVYAKITSFIGTYDHFISTIMITQDRTGDITQNPKNLSKMLNLDVIDNLSKDVEIERKMLVTETNTLKRMAPQKVAQPTGAASDVQKHEATLRALQDRSAALYKQYDERCSITDDERKELSAMDRTRAVLPISSVDEAIGKIKSKMLPSEEMSEIEYNTIMKRIEAIQKYPEQIAMANAAIHDLQKKMLPEPKFKKHDIPEVRNHAGDFAWNASCGDCVKNKRSCGTMIEVQKYHDIIQDLKLVTNIEPNRIIRAKIDKIMAARDAIQNATEPLAPLVHRLTMADNVKHNANLMIEYSECVAYRRYCHLSHALKTSENNTKIDAEGSRIRVEIDMIQTQVSDGRNHKIQKQAADLYTKWQSDLDAAQAKLTTIKTYGECLKKIPAMLFGRSIKIIQADVNARLADMDCPYGLNLRYDKTFVIEIERDGTLLPLELGSGAQKFTISLCLRIALSRLVLRSIPHMLLIDEGFGNLDEFNLESTKQMLQKLVSQYDFILIVTHVSELQDCIAMPIFIDVAKHGSTIGIATNAVDHIQVCEVDGVSKYMCNICNSRFAYKAASRRQHEQTATHARALRALA